MRYAICNETFDGWDHARVCGRVAELGYTGLEVAPFTLAPLITDVSAARRTELRRQAESVGVQIIGLHWLLAKTTGFQLTSPDASVRKRTGDYLAELARCAADLGGDLLVLGSPLQRNIPEGYTRQQAMEFAADSLRYCLPALDATGVKVCLEPLTPKETNFLNTAMEAVELIRKLAHPKVKLHLDVKAMSAEAEPASEVIRANTAHTYHFHANDPTDPPRFAPGFGTYDLRPEFAALKETGYSGWVSVEVFAYTPDPDTIAKRAIEFMRSCEEELA
jgi:sugar phosphate isomerase/epimerase